MPTARPASLPTEKRSSRAPLYITLALIAALAGCWFGWPAFQDQAREAWEVLKSGEQPRIAAWMRQFGYWGPVVLVLAMVVQMFLFVVNVVLLILVAILAYGPWWGSLLALLGVVAASSVGYALGRALGESFIQKLLGRKTEQKVLDVVDRYGVWAIIIARLSPALSDDAISFVAGLARMGYWKFMAATVAGVVPLIALLAYLGEDSERLKTGLLWVTGVSVVLFGAYVWWDRNRTKQK
ncbi:TVP38/TMEM64 family protein [Hymenobacter endophyticus]|uniref:TVP38/TMEM64 family membrane protein n=1 Tax=Hymenobacter endophyticus TaxID=3076335 RepID=A0ABU3TMS9_9BACT|nr:TVP38/TMEM64 family protein [Hymenobacter endophyticus]MDU0372696.1 TVP38/TMEM64 family protein [Hymenobacter endophyticus]